MTNDNNDDIVASKETAEKCLLLDESVIHSEFAALLDKQSSSSAASSSSALRVCCYGSSSSKTPAIYLKEAAAVGYLLAVRGHTCVNGAGSYGCMAAMNEGAAAGNGHIVGVIHEMWLVDGPENDKDEKNREWKTIRPLRDGGAHRIFEEQHDSSGDLEKKKKRSGPIREMLVAGGKDLQERKRLLVDQADALIVLPGGPGTWDELWEMACARNIGLTQLPIVCVNTNGYYEPFRTMLERAWQDQLTKLQPHQILHFSETAEEAVQWVEDVVAAATAKEGDDDNAAAAAAAAAAATTTTTELPKLQKRSVLRKASVLTRPITEKSDEDASFLQSIRRSISNVSDAFRRPNSSSVNGDNNDDDDMAGMRGTGEAELALVSCLVFAVGVSVGYFLSGRRQVRFS